MIYLKNSIKSGAIINFVSKYAQVVIQLVINAILARYISPKEFGIVAVITVFTTFFSIFSDMGISTGIIQYKNLQKKDYENIFSCTVYLGFFLAIIFFIISFLIAKIYEDFIYINLGFILSFSLWLNTVNAVPQGLLSKEQNFKLIGLRTITVSVICGIITVFLAINGFSYYSIVINSVLNSLCIFIWNYWCNRIRFHFIFDLSSIKIIFSFSLFQFLFNLVNYFTRNLDNLLVGKIMGEEQLGLYDKSYKLTTYSLSVIPGIVNPVLHPVLSNYQNNKKEMYKQYLNVVRILTLLGSFVQSFFFFAGEEIIYIMYGSQWIQSVTSFKFLALSLFSQFACTTSGAIFQSLGKTNVMFLQCLSTTSISVIFTFIGIFFGSIEATALFVMIAFNLHFFIVYYFLINKGFGFKLRRFIKDILFSFIVLFVNMLLVLVIKFNIQSIFLSLLVKGLICFLPFSIAFIISIKNKYIKL